MRSHVTLLRSLLVVPALAVPALADTFVLQPGPGDGKDAYVDSRSPFNYGPADYVQAGYADGGGQEAAFQFDLTGLPVTGVTSAVFWLYDFGANEGGSVGDVFQLDRIVTPWDENAVTWSNPPHPAGAIDTYSIRGIDSGTWLQFDITSLYNQWVAGTVVNNGLLLSPISGDGAFAFVAYSSDYMGDPSLRPKLVVTGDAPVQTVPEPGATALAVAGLMAALRRARARPRTIA